MRRRGIAALVAATLVIAFPVGAAAAAPVKPVVSMSVDVTAPEVGDTVTVKGVVTHVPLSTTVQIQRRTGSGWHRFAVGFTGGKGEYIVTFIASGLSREPLRALVSATHSHVAAASVTRTITVYDWFPLNGATPVKQTGTVVRDAAQVLGQPHQDVVVFAPTAKALRPSATWELDGVCTDVRSNTVWDETTPGQDTVRIAVDGVTRVSTTVTKVTGVAAELHHARFVTLETDGTAGVADQRAAWEDADVRCTEDPADV